MVYWLSTQLDTFGAISTIWCKQQSVSGDTGIYDALNWIADVWNAVCDKTWGFRAHGTQNHRCKSQNRADRFWRNHKILDVTRWMNYPNLTQFLWISIFYIVQSMMGHNDRQSSILLWGPDSPTPPYQLKSKQQNVVITSAAYSQNCLGNCENCSQIPS